jgi:hypothetical protein
MPTTLTFDRHEQGWSAAMPPEMAQAAGVAEGSIIVVHASPGQVSVEVLPPATESMKQEVREIAEKFRDLFGELKRHGD